MATENRVVDSVDIEIYLTFTKALIKKYGNFKMPQDLHNLIIKNLCQICRSVEEIKKWK